MHTNEDLSIFGKDETVFHIHIPPGDNRYTPELLIAAPDLLEACKAALDFDAWQTWSNHAELTEKLEAAIAKAEGR